MTTTTHDLWSLVKFRPQVDPSDLAEAIEHEARGDQLDYRTRLLIRDGMEALRGHWGKDAWTQWLERSSVRLHLEQVYQEEFEREGFPSLSSRLMKKTSAAEIKSFLRELGLGTTVRLRLDVAGSVAVILPGLLEKSTDDVDVMDEVPQQIRDNHQLNAELKARYGLYVGHVQRHYFPMRWEQRLHYAGEFGNLTIYLLDAKDVFLSKLFSRRSKDKDDTLVLSRHVGKEDLAQILKNDCQSLLASEELRDIAAKNWYVLYGEDLPA